MRKQITVTAETQEALSTLAGEALSVGTVLTLTAPKSVVGRSCECGCGGKTSGGFWVPGHDAKHKSKLFTAYRTGTPKERTAAAEEMTRRDWPLPNAKQDRKQEAASS